MSTAESSELADVLDRVKDWTPQLRMALANGILESLTSISATTAAPGQSGIPGPTAASPRGPSLAEVQAMLATDRPPPDDETVKRWIDEHRSEKYG